MEVRPKHAVCVKCGYEFGGGVELEHGYLVCPECAHLFDARGASLRDSRRRRPARLAKVGWMVAVVLSLVVPVAIVLGFFALAPQFSWGRALVAVGVVVAIVVLVWVARWARSAAS